MILSKLKTLAKQSEKLSKEESPDTEAVDEIFQVLEGAELSVEQLEKSNIGKAVNMLRKTCSVDVCSWFGMHSHYLTS
eukprot:m.29985 g.29985  ORF g.29985 m.29985 type:complete len:78 (-) comp11996_c0_seq2:922-1155(-)